MPENELRALADGIDGLQQHALRLIGMNFGSQESVFNRLQLSDLAEVIELDISCRASIRALADVVLRVEVSDRMYGVFTADTAFLVSALAECDIPASVRDAYASVVRAVRPGARLAVQDVFTAISVLVTTVALCLTQLALPQQREAVRKLDGLLAVKEKQLELMKQMKRWDSDFSPR